MTSEIESLNAYQQLCLRTTIGTMDEKMTHLAWSLALAGEAGELANRTKKVFIHGHPMSKIRLLKNWAIFSGMWPCMHMILESIYKRLPSERRQVADALSGGLYL